MEVRTVALMVSDFEDGGVERNFTRLALGLARLGVGTSLLVGNPGHPYLDGLDGAVSIQRVSGDRSGFLRNYLAREGPDILLTGKLADDMAAVAARGNTAAAPATRLVAAVGTLMSGRLAGHGWDPVKNWRETRRIRSCYVRLDGLTAVSRAVADDLTHHFGITRVPIAVLNNPILPDDLDTLAAAPCRHPWLQDPRGAERPPVILALGGLRQVKDFATLLRAFALLPRPNARLLIIGEGKEREKLAALGRRLGIAGRVDLRGFVDNPFPYLARSDLVVLSSRREGLPNVLVESMALGTPVVATDCSGGVRELLQDGRLGALAPVGDPQALNRAITRAIDDVRMGALDPDPLRAAPRPYHLLPAARAYLKFFAKLDRADASSPASDQTAL